MNKVEKYLKVMATCTVIQTVVMMIAFLCDLLSEDEEEYIFDDDDEKVVPFGDE